MEKDVDEFYFYTGKIRRRKICKECLKKAQKEYYDENAEMLLVKARERHQRTYIKKGRAVVRRKLRTIVTVDGKECRECKKCGVIKPVERFDFLNKSKNYRNTYCKECRAKYKSTRIRTQRQEARDRKYYKENCEKIKAYNLRRYYENKRKREEGST
jgi:hypothetical protein